MKLGVMQPYLFPYIGYYQLVNSVDKFVFYDDVTFIKGGYINRNNILSNGKPQRFTIPIPGSSSNTLIKDLLFDANVKKTLKTLEQSYRKAPNFNEVFDLIQDTFTHKERKVSQLCSKSIVDVFNYLGIEKEFHFSSDIIYERNLSASDKLISMSHNLNTSTYVNTSGGKSLYSKEYFGKNLIELKFIETMPIKYRQSSDNFVSNLSMIDVLMWNDKDTIKRLLRECRLI